MASKYSSWRDIIEAISQPDFHAWMKRTRNPYVETPDDFIRAYPVKKPTREDIERSKAEGGLYNILPVDDTDGPSGGDAADRDILDQQVATWFLQVREALDNADDLLGETRYEYVYTTTSTNTLATSKYPSNDWAYSRPGEVDGQTWVSTRPATSSTNRFLWRSQREIPRDVEAADAVTANWDTPILLNQAGQDGKDAKGLEYIFAVFSSLTLPTDKRPSDDWGYRSGGTADGLTWSATPPSVTADNPFLFMSVRVIIGAPEDGDTVTAGSWTVPAVQGHFADDGSDGTDGLGFEPVYAVTATATLPTNQHPSNDWGYQSYGTVNGLTWQADPPGVSASMPYLWQARRGISGNPTLNAAVSASWTTPVIISSYGEQGEDGVGAQGPQGIYDVKIYRAVAEGADAPATPTGGDKDNAPANWQFSIPSTVNMDVYQSVASYNPATSTLATWSVPFPIGAEGPAGDTGAAGAGIESVYTAFNMDSMPSNRRPQNTWGYKSGGTRNTQVWTSEPPNLTATIPYLFRADRDIVGKPAAGSTVTDSWSTPTVVGRYGGDGNPGVDGAGYEYIYAKYSSSELSANLYPSNDWGYDSPGTARQISAEFGPITLPRNAFHSGSTIALEPLAADRPEITGDDFVTSGTRRYLGSIRLYRNDGRVEITFVPDRTTSALATRADLVDGFETNGEMEIEIADNSGTFQVLRVALDGSDRAEPYLWTPGNSAEVITFADGFASALGNQNRVSKVTFRILSGNVTLEWHDDAPDLDADNEYLFRAQRKITGTPAVGDTVDGDWETPRVVGRFGRPGDDGDPGAAGTGVEAIYAVYDEATLPSGLRPSNDWGYDEPGTVTQDVEMVMPLQANAFRAGTTIRLLPLTSDRPQITNEAFLRAGSTRYLTRVRLRQSDGQVVLDTASSRGDPATNNQVRLSDAFESSGQLVVEIVDASSVTRTLTVSLSGASTSNPYAWIPTNSADVIAFVNRFASAAEGAFASTVKLVIPDHEALRWYDDAPDVTATNPYRFRAQRKITGTPAVGADVSDEWKTPVVVGRFGIDATGFEYIYAVTVTENLPSNQRPSNDWGYDEPGTVNGLRWHDAAPSVTAGFPILWRAQRKIVGSPAVGDDVEDDWTLPTVAGRRGPTGTPGTSPALPDLPDLDVYPFSYGLPYDTRNTAFGAAVDPGEWVARDADGNAISGAINWNNVKMLDFSQRDAEGADRRLFLGAKDWEESGQLIAIRRDDDDGTKNIVGFKTNDEVAIVTGSTTAWRFKVDRFVGSDRGTLSKIAPTVGDEYKIRLLLPDLLLGLATSRRPNYFWAEISQTVADLLNGLDDDDDWPQSAIDLANSLTPGENRIRDRVMLFRGNIWSVREWNGTEWIAFQDGHIGGDVLAYEGILARHIAAFQINANHIQSDVIVGRHVLAGQLIVKNDLMIQNGIILFKHLHPDLLKSVTRTTTGGTPGTTPPTAPTRPGSTSSTVTSQTTLTTFPSVWSTLSLDSGDVVIRRDYPAEAISISVTITSIALTITGGVQAATKSDAQPNPSGYGLFDVPDYMTRHARVYRDYTEPIYDNKTGLVEYPYSSYAYFDYNIGWLLRLNQATITVRILAGPSYSGATVIFTKDFTLSDIQLASGTTRLIWRTGFGQGWFPRPTSTHTDSAYDPRLSPLKDIQYRILYPGGRMTYPTDNDRIIVLLTERFKPQSGSGTYTWNNPGVLGGNVSEANSPLGQQLKLYVDWRVSRLSLFRDSRNTVQALSAKVAMNSRVTVSEARPFG